MQIKFGYLVAMVPLLAACAPTPRIPLVNAPETPGAQGTVAAQAGDNGNTRLTVEVKHLAPPEKVSGAAKVYVVWVKPKDGSPQNVGALVVDQNLYGRLDTLTPFQSFELIVSAEQYPTTMQPSGPRVLTAMVDH